MSALHAPVAPGATRIGFAELVRTARLRAGLTQQELAGLSALSVRAVRELEAGRVRRPRRDTVRLLAAALRLAPAAELEFLDAATAEFRNGVPALTGSHAAHEELLLGRDAELAALQELLIAGHQRLISVVGLPGAGKSRLVQEIARRCVTLGWQVSRDPGQFTAADSRVHLLLLDDERQQPELVLQWRRSDPALRILHCSTTPLNVADEQVLPLAGLPAAVAADGVLLAEEPAVALFLSHARRGRPCLLPAPAELAMIAEVCRLLDGLPAAIGHAADWSLVLSWEQLLEAAQQDPTGICESPSQPAGRQWQNVVRSTVRQLPPEQLRLLAELAVRPGSLAQLRQRLNRSPVELAKPLHALTLRGLLRCSDSAGQPSFTVPHLVRRVLLPC